MRPYLLVGLFIAGAALSTAAYPQLLGEVIEGTHRRCIYGRSRVDLAGAERQRAARVGLAENCPSTFPIRIENGPAPPTAALASERIDRDVRVCVYEQLGYQWEQVISIRSTCPIAAGMVPQNTEPPPQRR